MEIFLVILSWLLFGTAASYFANERGRDPFAWFFIGMFLGVIGLILLFILPKVESTEELSNLPPAPPLKQEEDSFAELKRQDWYYINDARVRMGPSPFLELKKLWEAGSVNSNTFVWCDGMPDWRRISDLPKFQEALK